MASQPLLKPVERIDLDERLRPQRREQVLPAGAIKTDVENMMDNWLVSSRESRLQRTSALPQERAAWKARKAFDPSEVCHMPGRWKYSKAPPEKVWVNHNLSSRWASVPDVVLDRASSPVYPAHDGDEEISWIHQDYWIGNNKEAFLNAIYKYAISLKLGLEESNGFKSTYGFLDESNTIPEETVWKIFRCLISELIPKVCLYNAIT